MGRFTILILTIGIPGAGKSTWVREYKKYHPYCYVVSTDEIRKELNGSPTFFHNQNEYVHNEARNRVKKILDSKDESSTQVNPLTNTVEIIVDSTNVDLKEWVEYKLLGASMMMAKYFDTNVDEAMEHQQNRERQVPRDIVELKWNTLQKNRSEIAKIFNFIF